MKTVLILHPDQKVVGPLLKGFEKLRANFAVIVSADTQKAWDALVFKHISIILTDIRILKFDEFAFLEKVQTGFPEATVLVMVPAGRQDLKVEALEHGASAFIDAPFRIDGLLEKITKVLALESDGGELRKVTPGMFSQLIGMEGKTCTVRVENMADGEVGVIFFRDGDVWDARIGDIRGVDAAYALFGFDEVNVSIQNSCPIVSRKVEEDVQAILMEALRRKDDSSGRSSEEFDEEEEIASDRDTLSEYSKIKAVKKGEAAETGEGFPAVLAAVKGKLEVALDIALSQSDLQTDPGWNQFVGVSAGIGSLLECGKLRVCCVESDGGALTAVLPGKNAILVKIQSRKMTESFLELLAN